MWNFFFKKLGKSLLPFLFFHPGIKKKLKPPISPDFLMCNVIKVINLIKLPPNDPLPGSYNFINHKMTKKYLFHKNNGVRIVQCYKIMLKSCVYYANLKIMKKTH